MTYEQLKKNLFHCPNCDFSALPAYAGQPYEAGNRDTASGLPGLYHYLYLHIAAWCKEGPSKKSDAELRRHVQRIMAADKVLAMQYKHLWSDEPVQPTGWTITQLD